VHNLGYNFNKLKTNGFYASYKDLVTPYDPLSVMQYDGKSFQIGKLPTLSYIKNGEDTGVPVESQARGSIIDYY